MRKAKINQSNFFSEKKERGLKSLKQVPKDKQKKKGRNLKFLRTKTTASYLGVKKNKKVRQQGVKHLER